MYVVALAGTVLIGDGVRGMPFIWRKPAAYTHVHIIVAYM